jgi:hypothetical protein
VGLLLLRRGEADGRRVFSEDWMTRWVEDVPGVLERIVAALR